MLCDDGVGDEAGDAHDLLANSSSWWYNATDDDDDAAAVDAANRTDGVVAGGRQKTETWAYGSMGIEGFCTYPIPEAWGVESDEKYDADRMHTYWRKLQKAAQRRSGRGRRRR